MSRKDDKKCAVDQEPTAWFVMLEIARREGDTEGERKALRKLQELGVLVAYTEPPVDDAENGGGLGHD